MCVRPESEWDWMAYRTFVDANLCEMARVLRGVKRETVRDNIVRCKPDKVVLLRMSIYCTG